MTISSKDARAGITYAISAEPYDGWVKLGRTQSVPDLRVRLMTLQTGNPRRLVIRATWMRDVEAELHLMYASLRGRGEWFALPLAAVEDMAAVAKDRDPLVSLTGRWPAWGIRSDAGSDDISASACAALFAAEALVRSTTVPQAILTEGLTT